MSSESLSERINIKKVVLILWSLYIFVFLAILLGDVGEILLSGNLVWDLFIVLGIIASGLPVVGFALLCLSIIWGGFKVIKDWLFDQ
jgi:hypothetical protein